jgi:glutathione S-transferase/GST-like protein
MSKPQVWTWEPNSNSGKPLFALCQKGVEFDYHYVNMTDFEHHTPGYLARNPAGTLPTKEHDGKVFTESTPMCEYIDRTWPDQGPQMVPPGPAARYRMRAIGRKITRHAAALSVLGWHNFVGPMARSKTQEERDRIIARIPTKERRIAWQTAMSATFTEEQLANARAAVGRGVMEMEELLTDNAFLAGPAYTVADLESFANFYSLPMTVPEYANKEKAPRYIDWLIRIYNMDGTMQAFGLARSLARRAFTIKAELEAGRQPVQVSLAEVQRQDAAGAAAAKA